MPTWQLETMIIIQEKFYSGVMLTVDHADKVNIYRRQNGFRRHVGHDFWERVKRRDLGDTCIGNNNVDASKRLDSSLEKGELVLPGRHVSFLGNGRSVGNNVMF